MIVNSNLVGRKERNKNNPPEGSDIFHPSAKNDWGTTDRIRGCLGSYMTIYESMPMPQVELQGEYTTSNLLINYSSYVGQLGEVAPGPAVDDAAIGPLRQQLLYPIMDYTIVPSSKSTAQAVVPFTRPPTPDTLSHTKYERINFTFSTSNWNSHSNRAEVAGNWINNNIAKFMGTDEWKEAGHQSAESGLSRGLSIDSAPTYNGNILDHTAVFYGPPRDLETREKSGLLFDPSPTYNFYVQTGVSYEGVIASGDVPEYLLPNAYYLQHELMNTSSALLANYHLDAITLAQNIDYFEISDNQTVTEANMRSYYNMYTDGLQDLIYDPRALYKAKASMISKNKDFAVLHSDLKALDKDAVHLSTVPFYNTIAIGAYQDQITGYADNKSILNALWDDKETRDFIDVLQYLAISYMTTNSSFVVSGSFTTAEKRARLDDGGALASPAYDTAPSREHPVLFDLGTLAASLQDKAGEAAMIYHKQMDENSGMTAPRIRDYTRKDMASDPQSTLSAISRLFDSAPEGDLASVRGVTRPMEKVFNNTPCHTETLLYVIHKRKAGGNFEGDKGPIIQTFYISPRLHSHMPAYFYDSQVKYNQQYQYDVSKVVLVFGNAYHYTSADNPVDYALDIWNETSVKAILVPHVIGGLAAGPILDKPPREPEISFYAYKGINDKLLILLNASTGKTVQSPVQILEEDKKYFEEEYYSQNGTFLTFDEIKAQEKKVIFKSDDPVDRYQLFKLQRAPKSYLDFTNSILPEIDPDYGVGGTLVDNIQPNTKYYYCGRSIDVHENVSNPTHIYEIEMIDNNGQIFLKQNIFNFEKESENLVKSGRRFIYIEPSLQQTVIDPSALGSTLGAPSLTNAPPTALLGAAGLADQVWGKGFKVRLTSKQTGRKLDLNINFTNTGKVKPSE